MTHEEAVNLKTFNNYCNCGGYAVKMNGRDVDSTHMAWCAQYAEWCEWRSAMNEVTRPIFGGKHND